MSGNDRPRPVVLLTGAAGQLGFELVRSLAPIGDVRTFDRTQLDLADATTLRACVRTIRPALIVNAAAYTGVDAAETDVVACHAVNAIAPAVLADEAARCGAGIIHYSTNYVFDGTSARAYREGDAASPVNVYGATKLEGERGVSASGAPYLVFRTSWVYSLRGHNFLCTMRRLFREREEVSVVSDEFGTPTWSRMLANATASIVAAKFLGPEHADAMRGIEGLYHLVARDATSRFDFASAIRELDPLRSLHQVRDLRSISTGELPASARRPANGVLDSSRLEDRLGVRLPDWRTQLALCMADARSRDHEGCFGSSKRPG